MNAFSGPLDLYLIIALKQNQVLLMWLSREVARPREAEPCLHAVSTDP